MVYLALLTLNSYQYLYNSVSFEKIGSHIAVLGCPHRRLDLAPLPFLPPLNCGCMLEGSCSDDVDKLPLYYKIWVHKQLIQIIG